MGCYSAFFMNETTTMQSRVRGMDLVSFAIDIFERFFWGLLQNNWGSATLHIIIHWDELRSCLGMERCDSLFWATDMLSGLRVSVIEIGPLHATVLTMMVLSSDITRGRGCTPFPLHLSSSAFWACLEIMRNYCTSFNLIFGLNKNQPLG